ncbi:MAG: filamentous hemagglutinin N-terminal domain-containing protein, partial [Symploca sp. SIO2B6]|nr:filamentous hemagglutinin N-terminal domain-containing protein [Symploca sp. SIO2B6]
MDYPRMMVIASFCIVSIGLDSGDGQQAIAQIVPDGTLSTHVTSSDSLNFVIEEGDRAGPNLFHSLEQFSISTMGSAHFNNSLDVDTIITRVTGSDASSIDGLLRANGTADVFLINPNGFIFGANAQLDVGGSFLATTADRALFDNGEYFSASDRQAIPLLTISAPVGLQMGRSPGGITLQGHGHQIIHTNDLFPLINPAPPSLGLSVNTGETLALIGSGITIDGAILSAPGGQVELGSVASGTVALVSQSQPQSQIQPQSQPQPWQFNYDDVTTFADLHLAQNALVDVSNLQSGFINLQGSNLLLESGATLLSQQFGPDASGTIALDAT